MSMLAPLMLAFLGLLPVIVLLYFLKLKRREELISSTYLWQRAIQDLRVNAPFQKLRQNLLLWLQLLLLALLVFALARPAMKVRPAGGTRYICLIDTSASMAARDVPPDRLSKARDEARELIDNMRANDEMMLMTFAARPAVLVPFTNIKGKLRQALEGIEVQETSTDFAQAAELLSALGPEIKGARLYLLSDGGFDPEVLERAPDVELNYIRTGAGADNVGITALDARRSIEDWDQPQVFVRMQNFGPLDADVRLELYLDGRLFAAEDETIPAGDGVAVTFSDPGLTEGQVRVTIAQEDDLAVDNTAWLSLVAPRQVRTLVVTPGNYFLELAVRNDPLCDSVFMDPVEFEAQVSAGELALAEFDLVVFDRYAPGSVPPGGYLFLGAVPPVEGFSAESEVEQPVVVDWDAMHPVNQYVSYSSLYLESAVELAGPAGAHTLVEGDTGPLILWWSSPSYRMVVVGFDMFASRWPLRVSFPIFLANVVRHLGGVQMSGGASRARPGSTITLEPPAGTDRVAVTYPDGREATVAVRSGRVTFGDTGRCGVYRFDLGQGRTLDYVVNLLDERESDIRPRESIEWQRETVPGTVRVAKENRELWPWLALLGLVVLIVEWYIYNRRAYI